jgi:beta-glucanase (GH16 family)
MYRVFLLAICAALGVGQCHAATPPAWRLVWSDEFNGPANAPPDPAKWNYDLGGGGWGNGEQETYTNARSNSFQDGHGHLVIRALRDGSGKYTSARLRSGRTTKGDTADNKWQFGKIEARIQMPFGPGIWPAFWMLGSDIATVAWPACGEIDILENFGPKTDQASTVHGTIHGPGYPGVGIGAPFRLPGSQRFAGGFHTFSVEWSRDSIRFLVDGVVYQTVTPQSLPANSIWAFNHPFFLLLNLAIGGKDTFLGEPAADTPFPQDMLIDYVRVYAPAAAR